MDPDRNNVDPKLGWKDQLHKYSLKILFQVGPAGKEGSPVRMCLQHLHTLCLRYMAALGALYGTHSGRW
jgi:hypothetical protein